MFIVALILVNIDLFSEYDYANLYNALLSAVLALIFGFFIFRGMK